MTSPSLLVTQGTGLLKRPEISCHVRDSIASRWHGALRTTADVDFFVLGETAFDRGKFARARTFALPGAEAAQLPIGSAGGASVSSGIGYPATVHAAHDRNRWFRPGSSRTVNSRFPPAWNAPAHRART
jgi:hypothetical protein